jgi:hypothetical protein
MLDALSCACSCAFYKYNLHLVSLSLTKYDIGDRIHASQVDTDTDVNGSMSKFSPLFCALCVAVFCLNFVV